MFRKIARYIREVIKSMREADLNLLATSMAFTTVFSIVPLLAVSLSVFRFLGGFEKFMGKFEPWILEYLTPGTGKQLVLGIEKAIDRIHTGTLGTMGMVVLLLATTKLFWDMEKAIQRIWAIKKPRALYKRIFIYWTTLAVAPIAAAVFLGVMTSRQSALKVYIPAKGISFSLIFIALFLLYKLVPFCKVSWRPALICAFVSASLITVAQAIYSVITKNFFYYNKIYGSIASIPIFLLWIHIIWIIVLFGATLNAAVQKKDDL
jgi:membrane protein